MFISGVSTPAPPICAWNIICKERNNMDYQAIGEAIDRLITVPMSNWTILKSLPLTEIYHYAREKAGEPLSMLAAKKIREAAAPGDTVLILTGFIIADWQKPETDGPIGAAALARSLELGLGVLPIVLCEDSIQSNMQKTLNAAGLIVCETMEEMQKGGRGRKALVKGFPVDHQAAQKEALRILDAYKPKAIISIERPGWNEKREHHSGMGYNISHLCAKLDYLFIEAQRRGIVTVGIGDLGNELGMGYVKEKVREKIPGAEKCLCSCGGGVACDVSCDVGIICNISNWGAYGVCASLAALCGNAEILHDRSTELRMIDECVRAGALDPVSGMHRPYVDGEPDFINGHIIDMLQSIVRHITDGSIFTKSYRETQFKKNP
jgi:hypothetical protein